MLTNRQPDLIMKSQKHYLLGFIVAALILILVGLVVIFGVEREKKDYV
mgnify:CR=1 FL=1